jgi:predicted short-subunit dehydrogenase-like oxidoreductase (DUF2520 family)
VTIVGPGSLGGALTVALHRAGFPVSEIVFRGDRSRAQKIARIAGSRLIPFQQATFNGKLVWICVGDRDIAKTARAMDKRVDWKGRYVFHSSGALSSDELNLLRRRGARVASVHPMMSFVRSSDTSFDGVSFALEGDQGAVRLAAMVTKELGGTSFKLKKQDKPLYHALGAFSSPLLVAQLAGAEKIGSILGLKPQQTRRVLEPILKKTLRNYLEHGPAAAFSGPLIRGDVQTIAAHLRALQRVRGMPEVYRALVEVALSELPVKERSAIRKLLDRD